MTLIRGNRRGRRGAVEEPEESRRESNQQERENVESFVEDETNYRREEVPGSSAQRRKNRS